MKTYAIVDWKHKKIAMCDNPEDARHTYKLFMVNFLIQIGVHQQVLEDWNKQDLMQIHKATLEDYCKHYGAEIEIVEAS